MSVSGHEYLTQLVDLAILVATIGSFAYLFGSGMLKSGAVPGSGRSLILAGIALTVIVQVTDLVLTVVQPWSLRLYETGVLSTAMPDWLHWLASRTAFTMIAIGVILTIVQRRKTEESIEFSRELAKAARDRIIKSEARFRLLVEATSNSVYCYAFDPPMPVTLSVDAQVMRSHDAILTECNESFAKDIGIGGIADLIGTRMGILDSNKDSEAYHAFFKAFVESDYRLTDYELIYKTPEGDDRALRISITGIVQDGRLHRMYGAESNILAMRQTKLALERRQLFQELLAETSSALVKAPIDDADQVVVDCLQNVCHFVRADRGTISWIDREKLLASVDYQWRSSPQPILSQVEMVQYPNVTRRILRGDVVRIEDVSAMSQEMAEDSETFKSLGIRSIVLMPLKVAGEIVGVVTYGNSHHCRAWTDQEVMDLRVIAELFANFLLRSKSRRALDEALNSLRIASDRLEAENVYLRQEIETARGFDEIIGESEELMRCLQDVKQVAATAAPVLLLGETGTGKELFARAIHDHSDRSHRPLVKVNCAALPANLIESELFGYEKGAFTGADKSKRGRFDLAHESTLFLDEIGDIPLELQPKLLRVLQEGEFERLGGGETVKVNVRIVAATNRNLQEAVQLGGFRSDLFYRINTFPIVVPPLSARGGDIQLLAEHFAKVHSQQLGRDISALSARMMRQLQEYSWPGNVRELEGVIQRAIISSTGPVLELAEGLRTPVAAFEDGTPRIVATSISELNVVQRDYILSVLEESDWKISGTDGAAARLGIPPSTLRSKMKRLSIERPH